jgi:uncharacterized protein (DUF2235 family)
LPKSIIICCDGTGNEIKENQSNVLKFYRILQKDNKQIAFYDTGIGTISDSGAWSTVKTKVKGVFGLMTGFGLDRNVMDAYRFLATHYKQGDQVYLFGFSRGAHTVRVLAGLIHLVGLLKPHQVHLTNYALTAYKQASLNDDYSIAWRVQEVLETQRVPIRFMGCWDTVASVIVPRPDRFYIPSLEELPFVNENPSVQVFRHALAVDERRRMFRVSPWQDPQKYKSNPFMSDEQAVPQDIKQVWFSGVHSDIGGGYPETESGAAKLPLKWMMEQAAEHGLVFRKRLPKYLVLGQNPKNNPRNYVAPSATAALHDSMSMGWKPLEWIPKMTRFKEWPERASRMGLYIPRSEPRKIPNNHQIHTSVLQRKKQVPDYRPENIPEQPVYLNGEELEDLVG